LIGKAPFRVKCFTSRRLNTKVSSGVVRNYLSQLEKNLEHHQLIECIGELHTKHKSRRKFQQGLNKLDKQSKDLMINVKKKCRKIKSGRIPFSPEADLWIRRSQVYQSLLHYHNGHIRNCGNLKRTARCCGIPNCFAITVEEVSLRLKVCTEKCNYFRKHGKQYRQKHLYQCLGKARESEDEDREKEILAIIQREKDRSFWRQLNYIMGKLRAGAVRRVLVKNWDQEGTLTENTTQESVQQAIFDNIHQKRFFLVEAAPICPGKLRGQFGYNSVTRTAKAILDGTYVYPEDFNQATKEICLECALI
jgi:hypothetical protein